MLQLLSKVRSRRFYRQQRQSSAILSHSMRKDDLLNMLVKIGRRQPSSLRKKQLINKIIGIQQAVSAGRDTLEEPEVLKKEDRREMDAKVVTVELLKASLSSWVMKPLVATSGMKEGSINEAEVLKSLPGFFDSARCSEADASDGMAICLISEDDLSTHLRVDYIKSLGLVCKTRNEMIGDSPDGLCGITKPNSEVICDIVEIKTMTSARTIEDAKTLANRFGTLFSVTGIGTSNKIDKVFQEVLPNTAYRPQCLHHAIVFGVEHVFFVVAKGSSMGSGGIIYAALLQFSQFLRNAYLHCLEGLQNAAFSWIGGPQSDIPREYDPLLQDSFASDLHSFASFYGLSMAYKTLVRERENPLSPARMIRPTMLVYWNALKGGVDEYSRAMKSLSKTNNSEDPIVSVIVLEHRV